MININLNIPNIFSMNKLANIVLNRIVRSIKDDNALPSGNVSHYTKAYADRKARGAAAKGQVSTHTANVNMYLTGGLINSLKVDTGSITTTSVTLKYGGEFDAAITQNEDVHKRNIRTLSSENIALVEAEFIRDVEQRIVNEFEKQNNIVIGELV